MGQPTIICGNCGRQVEHRAHGLCSTCYNYFWRTENANAYQGYNQKYERARLGQCPDCGTKISRGHIHCRSCARRGEKNPAWKNGHIYSGHGYILVWKPTHPNVSKLGYVLEHRLVIEEELGRLLKVEEVVHHINGIRDDNRIENLALFATQKEHIQKCHVAREGLPLTEQATSKPPWY